MYLQQKYSLWPTVTKLTFKQRKTNRFAKDKIVPMNHRTHMLNLIENIFPITCLRTLRGLVRTCPSEPLGRWQNLQFSPVDTWNNDDLFWTKSFRENMRLKNDTLDWAVRAAYNYGWVNAKSWCWWQKKSGRLIAFALQGVERLFRRNF